MVTKKRLLAFLLLAVTFSTAIRSQSSDLGLTTAAEYLVYNREYFGGHLPKAVRFYELHDPRFHALTDYDTGAKLFSVGINPKVDVTDGERRMTLLHEMCHISLMNSPEFDQHGPHFKMCMLRLAVEGAFDGLW